MVPSGNFIPIYTFVTKSENCITLPLYLPINVSPL